LQARKECPFGFSFPSFFSFSFILFSSLPKPTIYKSRIIVV
jgi:hypothetical protein